jgi:hypothetical protein
MPRRKRTTKSQLASIQREGRWRYIARLMLVGLPQPKIARKLRMTPRNLRYLVSTPEFELILTELQREREKRMAGIMDALDYAAVKGMVKLLMDPDAKIRLSVIQHLHSLRRKVLEKVEEHPSAPIQLDDMSPEQRDATRAYLAAMRQAVGQRRALPIGLQPPAESV